MEFDVHTEDDDELWLLERIVKRLCNDYGHPEALALSALNTYLKKFTDSQYCTRYNLSTQSFEFWCRAESAEMADRVQYHIVLGNEPNEAEFIQWERAVRRA